MDRGGVMSGGFSVRIQINPTSYKTLPIDGELARELADAVGEVRDAAEFERSARTLFEAGKTHLTALQFALERRRDMEERAIEMFRMILEGIPGHPRAEAGKPPAAARRRRKPDVAP